MVWGVVYGGVCGGCFVVLTFLFLLFLLRHVTTGNNSIDDLLPNAHTCDFSLLLPAYSSYSIMRKKLLRAISEQGFDLDGGATGTLSMMPDEVEEEEEEEEDSDEDDAIGN